MPPKKIINPKQVTNPLTSFFNPLTKHEIAVNKAKIDLEILDDSNGFGVYNRYKIKNLTVKPFNLISVKLLL